MKVSELLPKLKANKYTYYNIDKMYIDDFKKCYNHLKKHKNKPIYTACMDEFNKFLNDPKLIDYTQKYNAIRVLTFNINHTGF